MEKCWHCGSGDTKPLADTYQCSLCGGETDYTGIPKAAGRNSDVVMRERNAAAS